MPVTIQTNKVKFKDPNNQGFITLDAIGSESAQEIQSKISGDVSNAIKNLNDATVAANASANTIAQAVSAAVAQGTDTTLTLSKVPADAKATGDSFTDLKNALNIARCINIAKPYALQYTYDADTTTYSLRWHEEPVTFYLKTTDNRQFRVSTNEGDVHLDTETTVAGAGAIAVCLDLTDNVIRLVKNYGNERYIQIAVLYQSSKAIFFGNDDLFYNKTLHHVSSDYRYLSVFDRACCFSGGKVLIDTVNNTVTLNNASFMGSITATNILTKYNAVLSINDLPQPGYAWGVFVEANNVYLANLRDALSVYADRRLERYLLFAYYNKKIYSPITIPSGFVYLDGEDQSPDVLRTTLLPAVDIYAHKMNTAHVINLDSKTAPFKYTFANGTYSIAWTTGEAQTVGLVDNTGSLYTITDSGNNYYLDTEATVTSPGGCVFVLDTVEKKAKLKGRTTQLVSDIQIAYLYVNGAKNWSNHLNNDSLFWNKTEEELSSLNKLTSLFDKNAFINSGTVNIDTTAMTVVFDNVLLLGAPSKTALATNVTATLNINDLSNPGYAWAVYATNDGGVYIANTKDITELRTTHNTDKYFLFAFYQNTVIAAQTIKPGTIFLNGEDQSPMAYRHERLYKNTSRIFKKVVCCGDSYTSGHIVDAEGVAHDTNEDYAWPHYMSLITGNNWINCGKSGANVWTWQTAARGLPTAQSVGRAQAYVIGLAINDASNSTRHIDVGTIDDIGTENRTYYAGLSKIVRELRAISPQAKIFIQTLPRTNAVYNDYNDAIRYIANLYHDNYETHLLDLRNYQSLYSEPSVIGDSIGGHYTGIGYEQFAEILNYVMSTYINAHIAEFQNVFSIPYDS